MKRLFTAALMTLVLSCGAASAQVYCGPRSFDGQHKNEVSGYLTSGKNVVTSYFFGESFNYTHHFTDRWSISGGEILQTKKGLVSINATGSYRIPTGRRSDLFLDARVVNNAYTRWSTYELLVNTSAQWVASYVDVRFGLSFIHYYKYKVKKDVVKG